MTDRDPRPAVPAVSATRMPMPEGGLGSHELETDSDDPAVLRQALQRAKERLTFYEGFDRIIGENIKRSGELMLETIALREDAQADEQGRIARETQLAAAYQAERTQTKALLVSLHDEIASFQTTTVSLAARVADALRTLEPDATEAEADDEQTAAAEPVVSPASASSTAAPIAEAAPTDDVAVKATPKASFRPIRHTPIRVEPTPDERDAEPDAEAPASGPTSETERRTIDLVVNGITRATNALAFQRELSGRDGILNVETREFAEGVLRLKVDIASDAALSDDALSAWTGQGGVRILTRQPNLIALELAEA